MWSAPAIIVAIVASLTEREIFDFMTENFRLAAEECENLAKLPVKGPTYNSFRHRIGKLEGACRQAAYWREDARWLPLGVKLEQCHQRAGDWLRRRSAPQLFIMLAELLRLAHKGAEECRTRATGKLGPVLPLAMPGPHREHRPVYVNNNPVTAGGIIIPQGVAIQ